MTKLALLALALAACSDDPAPRASIEMVTPDALTASDDTLDDLTITLTYDDADGDLGGGVAEVHDCRSDDLMTPLAIPGIAAAKGDHITGTLELHVNDVGVAPAAALPATCSDLGVARLAADHSVFCIVLVDAAGHRGAGSCTEPLAITP